MLVWMLPPADASSEGLFMETLRVLVRSPHLRHRAPRYERERKEEQLTLFQQVPTDRELVNCSREEQRPHAAMECRLPCSSRSTSRPPAYTERRSVCCMLACPGLS